NIRRLDLRPERIGGVLFVGIGGKIPASLPSRLRLREKPAAADVERVFGITFAANKEGFESEYINVKIDGKDTKLRVETNLSISVLAEPPSPRVLIGTERTDDAVIISNRGTVSVRLTGGKVCRQGGVNQCIPINQKRLYPDDSWRLKVPADWSVSFIKDSVLGFEPLFVAPMER
ncbi:MAG: hypothetical protein GYA55_10510, partial [SAR324 cluster bacterium]|nr:hypothetical protein [SAR324 cluster bacterium]